MATVSVIIPVYKVETYLRRCLDSIVNQTYKDLEIILIDDGSPDNCGKICDEYAAKDSRVTVIHKENEGLSEARNDGIRRATGEWLAFVDSDDWCELDYYQQLLAAMQDKTPDVIFAGGYFMDYPATRRMIHTFNKPCSYNDHEHIEDLQAGVIRYGLPWDKLYRAAFLKESGFQFTCDIHVCEDFLFNFQVFAEVHNVLVSSAIGYHYRQVRTSIANGYNSDRPYVNYVYLSRLHDCAQTYGMTAKLQDGVNAAAISAIAVTMNGYYFHPANPKKRVDIYKELNEMVNQPIFHEAIYSRSNRYLSKRQLILKYALRMNRGGGYFVCFIRPSRSWRGSPTVPDLELLLPCVSLR